VAKIAPYVENTSGSNSVAADAATVTITGSGFDATAGGSNSVVFNDGAAGLVTAATPTSLTVTFTTSPTNENPVTAGILTAVVTTDTVSSGVAVPVATITPVVTSSTANLAANTSTLVINGFGFDPNNLDDSVAFTPGGVVGTVTDASTSSLTVTFSAPPTALGELEAVVTTDGQTSGSAVQVATVVPAVTSGVTSLAANAPLNAPSLIINGFGFDTTNPTATNTVTFND